MRLKRAAVRCSLLIAPVLLLVGGWSVWEGLGGGKASRAEESARDVSCRYLAQIYHLPHEARVVQVWIPLAKSGREQRVLRRDIRAPAPYTVTQDPDYGNDILHVTLKPPISDFLEIAVDYRARLLGGDGAAENLPPVPDTLQRSLQPSGLVIIDDEVQARTREATAGRLTPATRARGIYDHVRRFMAYDKTVPGWGRGDTRRACLVGKGNCTDFHSLFISMARAAGIPAQFKIGVVIPPESSGVIPGYHCWAEFYEEGWGWVPVDASEAWKHSELADYYFGATDPNRFLVSTGRDIRLVPKQQGGPVNIFFSPYIEVDGQPFSQANVEVRLTDLQHGRKT